MFAELINGCFSHSCRCSACDCPSFSLLTHCGTRYGIDDLDSVQVALGVR